MLVHFVGAAVVSLLCVWTLFLLFIFACRPSGASLSNVLVFLPDVLRLVRGLWGDASLPRSIRLRLGLLIVYLASPIDLIPDFIPVIGYADDALLVAIVLRSVVRSAGPEAIERHWTGAPEGLAAIRNMAGSVDREL